MFDFQALVVLIIGVLLFIFEEPISRLISGIIKGIAIVIVLIALYFMIISVF